MKTTGFFIIFAVIGVFQLSGFSFQGLDISSSANEEKLLFITDFQSQKTLFLSRFENLTNITMQPLTAFPERLELLDGGRSILVINRLGAVKIPASGGLPQTLEGFSSFANGNIPLLGRGQDAAVSPNGRWILYTEPVSPAYGNLILLDTSSGIKRTVSERIELPSINFPARFSPDSRLFVYSKGGRLFYFPIVSDFSVIVDERFRQIGPGEITAVLWGQQGGFYYFHENILYRVINPELFTRAFYGDFLSIGEVLAVLPFNFESAFDRYWISPDSGSILVNKRGKSFFLFQLGDNQYSNSVLPHIMIPQGNGNISVFWPSSGHLTIISTRQNNTTAWRFEVSGRTIRTVPNAAVPLSSNGILSPDGTRIVFWGEHGLELWNYRNWTLIRRLSEQNIYSCVWLNNSEIAAGNSNFIEAINVASPNFSRRIISLSSTEQAGFEDSPSREGAPSSRILARAGERWFSTNGTDPWTPVNNPVMRDVSLASERFRVYLENQHSGFFINIPMIRDTGSMRAASLVQNHFANTAYPQTAQGMQIALCFDLYDDDTGLSRILNTLSRFNIRATFFMNGDFIRRNPHSASAIIDAGHEAASLFYAPIDLSDARYSITADFIAQGLARNEDEFLRATGRELSALWHPPFFRNSQIASTAASSLGYTTVSRDADPGDWLSREEALRLNLREVPASEIIEQIVQTGKNGAVIPVRVGLLQGGRDDYLFRRIDVLIDALIRCGFEIVPVSAVIEK